MGELRYNPVTKKWAVISPERGTHRNSYITNDTITSMPCPFCDKDGGINKKLRSIFTINLPESSCPALIVTPNKYPVMGIEGSLNRKAYGIYDKMASIGAI